MKKLLIVTGSVRENRIADNILAQVQEELKSYKDYAVSVADLKELGLPFFNAPFSPSNENFKPTDENVIAWGKMVEEADTVLFLVAEYNYSLTAVLKNAIDWLYAEWKDKPIGLIGYGWVGGARAIKHVRDILASTISAKPFEVEANLRFTKEIDLEGRALNEDASREIRKVLEAI